MKLFLIEDDQSLIKMIQEQLQKYHYECYTVNDFSAIIEEFNKIEPDLVLMDINLPYYDGFYWCKKLREYTHVPIIFISARENHMDQVVALEYGADDYLVKPFSYDLLLAKIKSHTRRVYGEYAKNQARVLNVEQLFYYPESLRIICGDKEDFLTSKEGALIELLISAYPNLVKREKILNKLWDDERFVDDNTLSVNIGRLRKKLYDLAPEYTIQTIRGKGYVLKNEGEE